MKALAACSYRASSFNSRWAARSGKTALPWFLIAIRATRRSFVHHARNNELLVSRSILKFEKSQETLLRTLESGH
ncbi:hypothetical protein MCP1_110024 [Candidatus Terasakiella magnetica]|nr:hypothetical protein MCP1_110024 [Candidatus Terasakiella magnetica]